MDRTADIVLTLPLPPSVNELKTWSPSGVRRSPAYLAWRKHAGLLVNLQRAGDRIPYRYVLRMVLPEQNADIDNLPKATSDLLEDMRVVTNDKHMRVLLVQVDEAREAGSMLVELWALPDPLPPARKRALRLRAA